HLKEFKKHEVPHEWYFVQAHGWDNSVWFQNELPLTSQEFYAIPGECRNFPQEEPSGPRCCRFHLFIHQTSEGRKMNALPPSLRVGELLGSFESFSGQYFAGVWDESQCILTMNESDRLIQPWWTKWTATDWGFAHYAAHGWAATGKLGPREFEAAFGGKTEWPIDVVVVYREFVANELAEVDLARAICDATPADEKRVIR